MNANVQNHGTECKIRVKSGDLAAQGKGTMTITHMPDGRFWVRVLLPSQTGALEPLDLTEVERVELVQTKTGWFDKGAWVKPVLVTTAALIGVPVVLDVALPVSEAASAGIKALFVGTWFSFIIFCVGISPVPEQLHCCLMCVLQCRDVQRRRDAIIPFYKSFHLFLLK